VALEVLAISTTAVLAQLVTQEHLSAVVVAVQDY
jgi:hypothetical protein